MADEVIAGRYRLEQRIGGGAMSEVWSAIDGELGRKVALKLLGRNADPARFEREARAAAALAHPNLCAIYAYGETHGRPFMVLEYLPGGTLEERLARGRLSDAEALRIATEIAAGLAHAHARGLVHRDLKPANVLFDREGRAKIADFGIARMGGDAGLTATGTVLGTAAYISPEQAAGETATAASDVYAFGVILFRMLTGHLPFESEDALVLAAMHRDQAAPPVASFRRDAPARLESLATAALAKSPTDRPRDGAALLAELGEPARPAGGETAATLILKPVRKRSRAAPVVVAAAVIAAAGVALAVAVTFSGGKTSPTSTSVPTTRPAQSTPVVSPPVTTALPATSTAPTTTALPTTTAEPTLPSTTFPTTTAPTTTAPPATTAPAPPPPTTTAPPPTTTAPPPTTTAPTTATTTTATTATTTTPAQPG